MKKSQKIAGALVAAGAMGAAIGSLVGGGILISKTLIRPKGTSEDIIGEFADLEKMKEYELKMAPCAEWAEKQTCEDVYITSRDGLKLHAFYLAAKEPSDKVLLLHHGFTSKAKDNMTHARFFHELGYEVLMLDLRAHGESEGKYVGFGVLDRYDTEDWLKWCVDRFGGDKKFVLHGTSMGATTVLMALGCPYAQEHASAVIADCAFTSPEAIFSHVMKKDYHLPSFPVMQIGEVYSRALAGYSFGDYSTVDALKENKVPVLFVHGEKDKFVPTWMSEQNYEAATCKKRILIVSEAGHGSSVFEDTELYEKTEKEFLEEVLV